MKIETLQIVERLDGYWLLMPCPNKAWCEVPLTLGPAHDSPIRGRVWHWDGNVEEPTITPPIDCDNASRCGQHRVIAAGTDARPLQEDDRPTVTRILQALPKQPHTPYAGWARYKNECADFVDRLRAALNA